jgi:xanthine dehydrogenase accessory factor
MSAPQPMPRVPERSPASSENWLRPVHDWPNEILTLLDAEATVARVVVARVRGSAPREVGACMLVSDTGMRGTIGGGRLEWEAIEASRALLADASAPAACVRKFVLGIELAQCCGGVVELWIERYTHAELAMLTRIARTARSEHVALVSTLTRERVTRQFISRSSAQMASASLQMEEQGLALTEPLHLPRPQLWLYGAGHVGQALVRVLADLPLHVTWIDSRTGQLPANVPSNVEPVMQQNPLDSVEHAPADALFLIMTHSHALDYALCRSVLRRNQLRWAGVIGSSSKAARFRSRLAKDGVPAPQIARLQCPIGIQGIHSKEPAAIAVAVAAQLLQLLPARASEQIAHGGCTADARDCARCELAYRTF